MGRGGEGSGGEERTTPPSLHQSAGTWGHVDVVCGDEKYRAGAESDLKMTQLRSSA